MDKWIFLMLIRSLGTCKVPGPSSDGQIWNKQQMVRIDEEATILSGAGVMINHSWLQSQQSSGGKPEPNSARYNQICCELMYVAAQTLRTSPSRKMKPTETFACPWISRPKVEFINISTRTVGHMTSCQVRGLLTTLKRQPTRSAVLFSLAFFCHLI